MKNHVGLCTPESMAKNVNIGIFSLTLNYVCYFFEIKELLLLSQ